MCEVGITENNIATTTKKQQKNPTSLQLLMKLKRLTLPPFTTPVEIYQSHAAEHLLSYTTVS